MTAVSKPRVAYIDIARGFAMLCIIAGHLNIATADKFVYTFHVPLFFLLSGYFLSTKLDIVSFVKQKARQLLVPYYVTGLAIIVFAVVINTILYEGYDAPSDAVGIFGALLYGAGSPHTEPFVIRHIGLLWFLWALFLSLIMVRLALKTKYPLIVVAVVALVGCLSSSYVWLPLSIQSACIASLFVYLGYWARQHAIFEKRPHPLLVVGLLVLWALCIAFDVRVAIVKGQIPLLGVFNSIGASYLIVLGCKFLEEHLRCVARPLNFIGQATLPMMSFHAIADFTFPNYLLYSVLGGAGLMHPICSVIVYAANVAWPLLGVFLTLRCPPLQRLYSMKPLSPLPPAKESA